MTISPAHAGIQDCKNAFRVFFRLTTRAAIAEKASNQNQVARSKGLADLMLGSKREAAIPADKKAISKEEFLTALSERMMKVEQFRIMRDYAQQLGIRVYLFGGTAASFAHYVFKELELEHGLKNYQPELFDYNFMSIFRSNQDADLVIDGPADKAKLFEQWMIAKFPHLQGSKTDWEVRLLREQVHDKIPLLGNEDFLNQHTDSNSVGLIEVSIPAKDEAILRDLKDWANPTPKFLEDILAQKLSFYFSDKHQTTSRFLARKNPHILSVIRYFIKAFQHELEMDPKDASQILAIINNFTNARQDANYVDEWLKKNVPKLFFNAMNVEYAWNILETTGLRAKLIALGDVDEKNSLAWWLNKEPLRSFEIGKGSGRTAEELGIGEVTHETNTIQAFEVITRSLSGRPNVFVSRPQVEGEAAVHGEGFYVRVGQRGARDTGLSVHMILDPKARLGTDFEMAGDYLIVKNKNALKVIHRVFSLDPLTYMKLMEDQKLATHDKGILYKLKSKIKARSGALSAEEKTAFLEWMRTQMMTGDKLYEASKFLAGDQKMKAAIISYLKQGPEYVRGFHLEMTEKFGADAEWMFDEDFWNTLLDRSDYEVLKKFSIVYLQSLSSLGILNSKEKIEIAERLLLKALSRVEKMSAYAKILLAGKDLEEAKKVKFFADLNFEPAILEKAMDELGSQFLVGLKTVEHLKLRNLISALEQRRKFSAHVFILSNVFVHGIPADHVDLLKEIVAGMGSTSGFADLLKRPEINLYPEIIRLILLGSEPAKEEFIVAFLNAPYSALHEDILIDLLKVTKVDLIKKVVRPALHSHRHFQTGAYDSVREALLVEDEKEMKMRLSTVDLEAIRKAYDEYSQRSIVKPEASAQALAGSQSKP